MNDSYIDDRKLHEECGVFGAYDFDCGDVASTIYYGLFALQHRGQESCGIAVSDTEGPKGKVLSHKDMGLVNEVFKEETLNRDTPQKIGNGYLSLNQIDLILNHLPMEITFVNKEEIFQYYNNHCSEEEMIFKRTPGQVGRNVELCHPPKYLEKVKTIMKNLRERKKDKYEMWFKSESRGKFVHVTYAGVYDENGEFQGVLEYVQNIAPYREINSDYYRGIE